MILYAGSFTEIITDDLGGHGEGIYCFDFDPVRGSLKRLHRQAARNPSYLCIPSTQYLYTHTEVLAKNKPRVQAYRIHKTDFSLQLLNEQEIPGGCPCHINFSPKNHCVLVACYETGNICLYPVAADGKLLPLAKMIRHEGSSLNPFRQEGAHPHAVVMDEDFHQILVPDLGLDKIMVYPLGPGSRSLNGHPKQELVLPPGSGPRHMALNSESKLAFLLNELNATVSVMRYDKGVLELLCTVETLAKEFTGIPSSGAIRVSANGKFLYISERVADCITVLRYDHQHNSLEIIGRQNSLGKTPRDIQLDPSGNWLLAANQDGNSVAIFRIDKTSGMISPGALAEPIQSPACLEWLPVNSTPFPKNIP
jgi:6-phosphogluconolactonase